MRPIPSPTTWIDRVKGIGEIVTRNIQDLEEQGSDLCERCANKTARHDLLQDVKTLKILIEKVEEEVENSTTFHDDKMLLTEFTGLLRGDLRSIERILIEESATTLEELDHRDRAQINRMVDSINDLIYDMTYELNAVEGVRTKHFRTFGKQFDDLVDQIRSHH